MTSFVAARAQLQRTTAHAGVTITAAESWLERSSAPPARTPTARTPTARLARLATSASDPAMQVGRRALLAARARSA
jgi:hypothetical protein